jgi:sugar/nucleoside kinase (ribokinase family)
MTVDIVCVGILVADVVVQQVDEIPPGGSLGLVGGVELHGGGCALNVASAAARLGLRASVCGKVGADALGDHLIHLLDEREVDTHQVLRAADATTSASVVLVAGDGERTFLHAPGANARLGASELDLDALYDARCVHAAGTGLLEQLDGEPLARILEGARGRGLTTSLDTAWDASGRWERVVPCLEHVDIACPSLAEARAVSGEQDIPAVAAWFRAHGPEWVALTMGPDGCYAAGPGFEGHVAAPHVEVVDSTGAGDAFAAGLVHARLAGWELDRAVRFACAAGALATTTVGASSGRAGLAETVALAG